MAPERRATVARVVDHGPGVRSLHLALDEPLAFLPGQFISCRVPLGASACTRAYSIASHPESPREIELLFSRVPGGPGSAYLFARVPGDPLPFTGPWGTFVLPAQPDAETVFVADGVTIAPIRPMLRRACVTGRHPVRLLYGQVPGQPLVYRDEIAALAAAYPRLAWEALPTADLEAAVGARFVRADTERGRCFFVCAIGDRARRLRRLLRDAGYARDAVRYERW